MGWLLTILKGAWDILRALMGPQPTITDKAAEAATAETELHQEQAANDVMQQGAAARAAADARQLQPGNGAVDAVDTDPAAPVNSSPDAHFRD